MDYIFFAFSAVCLGFAFLLAVLLQGRGDKQLLLRHLLLGGLISFIYYYLEVSVFNKVIMMYYLSNLLPQAILLLLLTIYLLKVNRN